jgi:GTPase SAR1 family protein
VDTLVQRHLLDAATPLEFGDNWFRLDRQQYVVHQDDDLPFGQFRAMVASLEFDMLADVHSLSTYETPTLSPSQTEMPMDFSVCQTKVPIDATPDLSPTPDLRQILNITFGPVLDDFKFIMNECLFHEIEADLPTEFPSIVVCGMQSAGKSSVMERLAGYRLFPRGDHLVTKMPFRLKLFRKSRRELEDMTGEPIRRLIRIMTLEGSMEDITAPHVEVVDVIRERMNALVDQAQSGISDQEFWLELHAPDVPNMDLIDLPGVVQGVGQGINPSVVPMSRTITQRYTNNRNNLVLAILPCTEAIINNSIWPIITANNILERTIGVLTKVDVMATRGPIRSQNINKIRGIGEEVVPLQPYGYIGICNGFTDTERTIQTIANEENAYFVETYPELVLEQLVGIQNLVSKIERAFTAHLQQLVPEVHREIGRIQLRTANALTQVPCVVDDSNYRSFVNYFYEKIKESCQLAFKQVYERLMRIEMVEDHHKNFLALLDSTEAVGNIPDAFYVWRRAYRQFATKQYEESTEYYLSVLFEFLNPSASDLPWSPSRFTQLKQELSKVIRSSFQSEAAQKYLNQMIKSLISNVWQLGPTRPSIVELHAKLIVFTMVEAIDNDIGVVIAPYFQSINAARLMSTECEHVSIKRTSLNAILQRLEEASQNLLPFQ